VKRLFITALLLANCSLLYSEKKTLPNSYIASPNRLHITAGLLLEQVRMLNTDVCMIKENTPQTPLTKNPTSNASIPSIFTNKFENLVFDLDIGLKTCLGYNFEHDDWVAQADFQWLQSKGSYSNKVLSRLQSLEPSNIGVLYYREALSKFPVSFQKVTAHLNVSYYLLDVYLSRGSFFSKNFSFEPSIGIKTSWIQYNGYQNFSDDANTDDYAMPSNVFWQRTSTVNFWGSGPMAGINSAFHVIDRWSLISSLDCSILLGKRKFITNQGFKGGVNSAIDILNAENNTPILSPTIAALLGIEYSQPIVEDTSHLTLRTYFDGRCYFNQYPIINSQIYNETINENIIYPSYKPVVVDNNIFGMIGCVIELIWSF
jgi:hypothetical protein